MTPEQIAAIKARLDAATPGPWEAHLSNTPPHYRETPVVSHKCGPSGDRLGRFVLWEGDPEQADRDALLIAHAPDDLAALLAYVKQLEGLLRDLCEDSRAVAEVVRLRKVVEVIRGREWFYTNSRDRFEVVALIDTALAPEAAR